MTSLKHCAWAIVQEVEMPVERQREYESVYIVRPNESDEDRDKTRAKVEAIITEQGGHVVRFDDWGTRKLAYEIRDRGNAEYFEQGRYQYLRYLAPTGTVAEIERNLRIIDNVLKYLTVKLADNLIPAEYLAQAGNAESAEA